MDLLCTMIHYIILYTTHYYILCTTVYFDLLGYIRARKTLSALWCAERQFYLQSLFSLFNPPVWGTGWPMLLSIIKLIESS